VRQYANMPIINPFLHKKQRHTNHADDRTNNLPDSDFLMEEKSCRGDDEDGRKRKKGLGDACWGV
jgi:hypothetical protein